MDRLARRVVASAVFVASLFGVRAAVAAGVLVPTQHNDNFRTGANLAETQLTPRNLDRLQRVDRYVDGPINTQVLYAAGVMIHGVPHNVAYVTTSKNSVYAFDADDRTSAPQGGFLWRTTLTDPQPSSRPWPRGINATPVLEFDGGGGTIDVLYSTANQFPWNSVFVDQELALQSTLDVRYYLVKLDLATGNVVKLSEPLQGSVARLGTTPLSFVAKNESDTASLLLDHGYIYASFSARQNENVSQYYGWMLRYKAADLTYAGAFNSQPFAWEWQGSQDPVYQPPADPKAFPPIACYHPDPSSGRLKPWGSWVKNGGAWTMACVGEGGGIWQGGAGPAADRSGNVYVLIGNGHYEPAQQSYGDSIVKLRSTADAFGPAASFAPPNELRDDETYDVDLGSAGPLYVDAAKRVVAGGKTGFFYVVDDGLTLKQQVLAGIDNRAPDPDGTLRYRTWNQGPHLHGSPTLWTISDRLGYVYEWAEKDYLKKYEFDFVAGTFKVDDPWYPWVRSETEIIASKCDQLLCLNAMPGGMLALSANGATPGSGIVWAILTKYEPSATASIYAFDADTLKKLWSDPIGAVPHFAGPTVADGHVFVPTNALLPRFSIYSLGTNAKPALRAARATRRWAWQTENAMAPMNSAIPDYAQHPAFRARMTLPAITRQLPPGLIAQAAYAVGGRETYACAAHKPLSCTWKRTEMQTAHSFDDRTERATASPLALHEPRAYAARAAAVSWPLAAEWQLLRKPGGLFGNAAYVLRVRTSFGAPPLDPHAGDNTVPFEAVYVALVRGR